MCVNKNVEELKKNLLGLENFKLTRKVVSSATNSCVPIPLLQQSPVRGVLRACCWLIDPFYIGCYSCFMDMKL